MNNNSPLGAIPAVVNRLLATRRAKAASSVRPAKPVRAISELALLGLIASMVAMIGFGVPHEIAGKLIALSLALSLALQTLRISRLLPERMVGSPPPTLNYVLSTTATILIFAAAFINPALYAAFGALTALIAVRLVMRLMPTVHSVMMERYAGHVERMESERAASKPR